MTIEFFFQSKRKNDCFICLGKNLIDFTRSVNHNKPFLKYYGIAPIIFPFLITNELITESETKGNLLIFILAVKALKSIIIAQFLPLENFD